MKDFVLRQFDLEITLRGGECVAEAEIRNTINKSAKLNDNAAGGNLLLQHAGRNAGGDPCRYHSGIETEFFNAVTV